MSLSTHVLDTVTGTPAAGITVTLTDATGRELSSATTNGDGRIAELGADLAAGVYRLVFDTGSYFDERNVPTFYPEIVVVFEMTDPAIRYHLPVLLSPHAYSTYRGS